MKGPKRLWRAGIGLLAAAVLLSGGVTYAQTTLGTPIRRGAVAVGDPTNLADFLAGIAGKVKPSDQLAVGARQAAAIAAAKSAAKSTATATQAGPRISAAGAMALAPTLPPGIVIGPGDTPDYFSTPNWAYSPALAKFVDPLPQLWDPRDGAAPAKSMPLAVPDTITFPGTDYYEIELQQYNEKLHRDMPATRLRGYVQVNKGTDAGGANTITPSGIRYLGPIIVAQKDRPVRIKFVNKLSTGAPGDLFVPVDKTIMGSGPFEINYDPVTKAPYVAGTPNLVGDFTENRATLHLHGGRTPWISDGTPHQWVTPKGEATSYAKGVSVEYVPDMWFYPTGHASEGQLIAECAGLAACAVTGATTDPGPGAETFYWTNQQSSRLMFYHDHAWGITRLNVYVGEAAGYLITEPAEQALVTAGLIPADQIPLVIQDKTFVDPASIVSTDPTWAWGSQPFTADPTDPLAPGMTPVLGDLWWPHVYMPAQNPFNPDLTGINAMGRWHYGPWFWPPTPVCGSIPQAVKPYCIDVGAQPNPYYEPDCDLATTGFCQPPEIPGTPNPSWGAEAFLDTMLVNGAVYPTVTIDPKPYRLRILNAAHDRFLNLQLYQAVSKNGYTNPTTTPYNFDGPALTDLTEVAMVDASINPAFPPLWPTDGREGGVPDPATAGPAFIQIGSEGGFLPAPVLIPNQPVSWNLDPTMFNVGNVLPQPDGGGTIILGPAERADVIVDFSDFAGKTLILYNDAPTAFPALDPHYDFYTGAPDRSDIGGLAAPATGLPAGFGPNVRTVMQIKVTGTGGAGTPNDHDATALADLQAAFTTTGTPGIAGYTPGVFAAHQEPIIVGQTAYDTTYNTTFPSTWPNWGLSRIGDNELSFLSVNHDGTTTDPTLPVTIPMKPKAIHDEMGGTFDDYGRMSAKLGLEVPFSNAAISTFALQNYVDPPSEFSRDSEIQVWKITHNGVDTHPIHFHLYDVQVVNRVGWDGFIRLPDPNEMGWKDTVRMAPLEDTIVALRPVVPIVPFPLPDSIRPLNPEQPLGSMMGFSQIDPLTGGRLAVPTENALYNFGWEYVWHCHILSHEENDMMRSIVFQMPPAAPTGLVAGPSAGTGVDLQWTDNAASETGFTMQYSADPTFPALLTTTLPPLPASAPNTSWDVQLTFNDTGAPAGQLYYRVQAYGENGVSAWSNIAPVAPTPLAGMAPASLSFGGAALGVTSAPQAVVLTNAGSAVLSISALGFAGTAAADFAQTNNCGGLPATVPAGGSCTFTFTFTPSAIGGRTASFAVTSDNPLPLSVSLTGTGLTPIAGVAPALLAFGGQNVGTTSAAQTVTLSNTGNAPLVVNSLGVTGADFADFVATNTCGALPASIAAGGSCTVGVTFAPTALGPRSADVTIGTNDPVNPTLSVALTGIGTQSIAGVSPLTLTFANQLVATTSASQPLTLSNTGTGPLTVSSIGLGGTNPADFGQTNTCGVLPAILAAGGSCTIDVTFTPAAAGASAATLTILNSDPVNGTLTVTLGGTGIAPIAGVAPAALDFAGQLLNTTSTAQTATLSNTGSADLTGITVALAGVNAAQYVLTNNCGALLAPLATCTIDVAFAPTVMGALPASLTIVSSDPVSPTLTVALTGTGDQPIAGISPAALAFGDRALGTSGSLGVVLTNSGNAALAGISLSVVGANPGDFSFATGCGPTLAAGANCVTIVSFTPTVAGLRTATLSVANTNDLARSPLDVTLTGTGLQPVAGIVPASLSFGSQLVLTASAGQAVTLSNTGNAPLVVNSIAIGGTNPGDFAQTNTCGALPASVAAGANCIITVSFTPAVAGPRVATLSIGSNDATNPTLSVALDGSGIAPIIGLAPGYLQFAGQPVGSTSAAQTFTLSNSGTADLTGITVALAGANPTQYVLTNNCGALLAPLATCTIDVAFAPTAPGGLNATLSIGSSDPVNPALSLGLYGTGAYSFAGVAPNTLAFGNRGLGTSTALGAALSNSGNMSLTGIAVSLVGTNPGDFSISNGCGTSLPAAGSCVVTVNFTPTATGARAATLRITNSNDPAHSPLDVSLTGFGLQPVAGLAPAGLTFPTQLMFTTSAAQTVTLSNTGSAPLTVNGFGLGGANPGDFAQTNTCGALPAVLAAGANCAVNVTFSPLALGARSASLSVASNDPVHPTVTTTLSGTGADIVPAAPSALTAAASVLAATPPTITLAWTDNSYNETGFIVQRATNSAFTSNLFLFTLAANTTSFTDGSVAVNRRYYYRVLAFNGVGSSAFTASANATTPGWLPATPTNLAFVTSTTTSITMSWTDNATNESSFRVQRATNPAGPWTTIANPGANVTSYRATGLTRNRTYYFRVRSSNGSGVSPWTPTLTAATLP